MYIQGNVFPGNIFPGNIFLGNIDEVPYRYSDNIKIKKQDFILLLYFF